MCSLALCLLIASGLTGTAPGPGAPLPASPCPGPKASDSKGWWHRGAAACGPGGQLRGGWPRHDFAACLDASGRNHGPYILFDRRSLACRQQGEYRHGERHGVHLEYFPDGLPKHLTTYVDGRRRGASIAWYPSGRPRYEARFRDNLLEGLQRSWHPGGQLAEVSHYQRGQVAGPRFLSFHPSGHKKLEIEYQGTLRHGALTRYDPTGARLVEEQYQKGRRHGVFTTWHPGGGRATEERYRQGRPHGLFTRWDARGRMLGAVRWKEGRVLGWSGAQP